VCEDISIDNIAEIILNNYNLYLKFKWRWALFAPVSFLNTQIRYSLSHQHI